MTGHICITFTTTILGLHIYQYYSSNSSTSKHTDLTRVITSVCRQSTHMRGPVTASLVTSAIDVSVFVRAASTRACAVWCMRFLAYFLRFRCLTITTLFNIDVKIRFRAVATASCSAAILRRCCGHISCSTRVPGISVYIFSCTLWNFSV